MIPRVESGKARVRKLSFLAFWMWLFPSGLDASAVSITEIHRFPEANARPSRPMIGSDGAFYGTCEGSGEFGHGWIYRFTTNGLITCVASFARTNGSLPKGGLVAGDEGAFYGTCFSGGSHGFGTVFRVTTNGILTSLASFTGSTGSNFGFRPAGLGKGRDGHFYGCTATSAFRLSSLGELVILSGLGTNAGLAFNGRLMEGSDGAFYGTAHNGGEFERGTLFRVTTNGVVNVVVNFALTNGASPEAGLVLGDDNQLYGTTEGGGVWDRGTIFRCTTNGNVTILYSFSGGVGDGSYPESALMKDQDGTFYGFASSSGEIGSKGIAFRLTTNGVFSRLVTLWTTNGTAEPHSEFIRGNDGALYAVTEGGAADAGVAFRMTQAGDQTLVASFKPGGGFGPTTALTRTSSGLIYGTTELGGSNGVGTVFCLNADGALIHSVSMERSKGAKPSSPLIPVGDGTFLGLAREGGEFGFGSIYRLNTNGSIALVSSFANSNGAAPCGATYLDANGNLYGTTWSGGSANDGTLFCASTNGTITRLASFNSSNGANPEAGLIRGYDGAFYGSTYNGGTYGAGAVFRGMTNGSLSALASFNPTNLGSRGRSTLVQMTNGLLYGTTFYGTAGTYGTLFRVSTNGVIAKQATFYDDQKYPIGPLIIGPGGAIYGTSLQGWFGYGTVFCARTNQGIASTLIDIGMGHSPYGGVISDGANRLFGTTSWGQTNGQTFGGLVFSVDVSAVLGMPSRQFNSCIVPFTGIPGATYTIQRAISPSGPWVTRGTDTTDTRGTGSYTDFSAPPNSTFYRLRQP